MIHANDVHSDTPTVGYTHILTPRITHVWSKMSLSPREFRRATEAGIFFEQILDVSFDTLETIYLIFGKR